MKKRLIKKYATMLIVRANDPDCKCYDRKMERHKRHYVKSFWYFIRNSNKRDWYWYYYYQGRAFDHMSHQEALTLADKCICEYIKYRKLK